MKLTTRSLNAYNLQCILKVSQATIRHWIGKLKYLNIIKVNLNSYGRETLYLLNGLGYPNIIKFFKYLIVSDLSKELKEKL